MDKLPRSTIRRSVTLEYGASRQSRLSRRASVESLEERTLLSIEPFTAFPTYAEVSNLDNGHGAVAFEVNANSSVPAARRGILISLAGATEPPRRLDHAAAVVGAKVESRQAVDAFGPRRTHGGSFRYRASPGKGQERTARYLVGLGLFQAHFPSTLGTIGQSEIRLVADIDGDDAVGGADLRAIRAALGRKGSGPSFDLDGDGKVTRRDLNLVRRNLGAGIRFGGGTQSIATLTAIPLQPQSAGRPLQVDGPSASVAVAKQAVPSNAPPVVFVISGGQLLEADDSRPESVLQKVAIPVQTSDSVSFQKALELLVLQL